jgi:hypothetical protein
MNSTPKYIRPMFIRGNWLIGRADDGRLVLLCGAEIVRYFSTLDHATDFVAAAEQLRK